jgi:hypothetical protein
MWGQYATANDERRYELVANARAMLDRGVDDEYVWRAAWSARSTRTIRHGTNGS